ncbi:MAG: DUF2975 domain-containing protein [Actinomycetota bacterium]
MIRRLASTVMLVGIVASIWGVAYDINGATQAKAEVAVSVHLRPERALKVDGTSPAGTPGAVLVEDGAEGLGPFAFSIPGIPGESTRLDGHGYTLTLRSWGSTVPEQLLNRGGFAVVGLCVGLGAVWLSRVLTSIAEGRPFQPGNAARIAGMGALVALATLANDILPVIGGHLVLQRLGLIGPSSPIYVEVVPSLGLLLMVPFLLVLAEAFRRGAELANELEGLV